MVNERIGPTMITILIWPQSKAPSGSFYIQIVAQMVGLGERLGKMTRCKTLACLDIRGKRHQCGENFQDNGKTRQNQTYVKAWISRSEKLVEVPNGWVDRLSLIG